MDREIKNVDFDSLESQVLAASINYVGVAEIDQRSGNLVFNTIEPPTYVRHREKWNIPSDRTEWYYPWGEDNQFPLFLLKLKNMSHTLRTIVTALERIAKGKGKTCVYELGEDQRETAAELKRWLSMVGANDDFDRRLFMNTCFFKGFTPELVYGAKAIDPDTGDLLVDWSSLSEVNCINFHKVRKGVRDEDGNISKYYFHRNQFDMQKRKRVNNKDLMAIDNWPGVEQAAEQGKKVTVHDYQRENPFFVSTDQNPDRDELGRGRYLYMSYMPSLEADEYPVPDCAGDSAINAALLDSYISQHETASMVNGLKTSHIVVIPLARPRRGASEEEKQKHERDKQVIETNLRENMTGMHNADGLLVIYKDPKSETEPIQIAEIPNNDNADNIESKSRRAERVLLAAYTVSHPAIIGLTPEQGKNMNQDRNMLTIAEGMFYSNTVYDYTQLIENFYNEVLLPIFSFETGLDVSGIRIAFPWSQKFKREIPSEVILKTMTLEKAFDYFGLEIRVDDEYRRDLMKDLILRSLGGNTADPALLLSVGLLDPNQAPPGIVNTDTENE